MREAQDIIDFNSSMVRLKDTSIGVVKISILFQFQYGTIKRNYLPQSHHQHNYFNSSMVRLKADRRFQKNI